MNIDSSYFLGIVMKTCFIKATIFSLLFILVQLIKGHRRTGERPDQGGKRPAAGPEESECAIESYRRDAQPAEVVPIGQSNQKLALSAGGWPWVWQ